MIDEWLGGLPLPVLGAAFGAAGLSIAIFGTSLARVADEVAEVSRIGQAITGGLFLGATTSLPGLITSTTAAWNGHAEMAVSNAIGGIGAQCAFLAIADICYRRANLEHAAASLANLMQAGLLMALLCLALLASQLPGGEVLGWVHPISPLMVAGYLYGMHLVARSHHRPMWRPRRTDATQPEPGPVAPDESAGGSSRRSAEPIRGLYTRFVVPGGGGSCLSGWVHLPYLSRASDLLAYDDPADDGGFDDGVAVA